MRGQQRAGLRCRRSATLAASPGVGFWGFFSWILKFTTDVWQEAPLPPPPERSRFSASVTFVIMCLTCIMMRQVIYVRSVARLCCSTGIALNSLSGHTPMAACAHRTGSPRAVVHPGGRDACRGVSGVLEWRLGFPPRRVLSVLVVPWLASASWAGCPNCEVQCVSEFSQLNSKNLVTVRTVRVCFFGEDHCPHVPFPLGLLL